MHLRVLKRESKLKHRAATPVFDNPSRRDEEHRKHVDWVITSTASNHVTHDRRVFKRNKKNNRNHTGGSSPYTTWPSFISFGDCKEAVVGIGTVILEVIASGNETVLLVLKNVLHVPNAVVNTISAQCINESGYEVVLNSRNRGGFFQEYHEFMPENKGYACITMNRNYFVLKTLYREIQPLIYDEDTDKWFRASPRKISATALLSYTWEAREEQLWREYLMKENKFAGEYIDRIIDELAEEDALQYEVIYQGLIKKQSTPKTQLTPKKSSTPDGDDEDDKTEHDSCQDEGAPGEDFSLTQFYKDDLDEDRWMESSGDQQSIRTEAATYMQFLNASSCFSVHSKLARPFTLTGTHELPQTHPNPHLIRPTKSPPLLLRNMIHNQPLHLLPPPRPLPNPNTHTPRPDRKLPLSKLIHLHPSPTPAK